MVDLHEGLEVTQLILLEHALESYERRSLHRNQIKSVVLNKRLQLDAYRQRVHDVVG